MLRHEFLKQAKAEVLKAAGIAMSPDEMDGSSMPFMAAFERLANPVTRTRFPDGMGGQRSAVQTYSDQNTPPPDAEDALLDTIVEAVNFYGKLKKPQLESILVRYQKP